MHVWTFGLHKPRQRRRVAAAALGLFALTASLLIIVSPLFGGVSHALGLDATELPRTVVATGLRNPRGMAFGPDGSLYIAEAGSAGRTRVEADPDPRKVRYHIGMTGRVSRVTPDGTQSVMVDGLPSALTAHDDDIGPAAMAVLDGRVYVITAAGGVPWGDATYDNGVFEVQPGGTVSRVFDYQGYNIRDPSLSRRTDPRADVPGGMPFGMTAFGGNLYTTDGNLEFVLQLTLDGQTQRLLEYPTSNYVMTGITAGPDGALYFSELGGYPYFEGTGKITRLDLAGNARYVWTGLTTPIGVAVANDGTLYATEYTAPLKQWENTGRVLRRTPDGKVTVLATGLNFPTAIALGPDGALYVTNNGHHSPDGSGQVIRMNPADASPVAMLWRRAAALHR